MTQDTQCVVHNNNDVVQAALEVRVEGESDMQFQLAQASFRAIVGTLAAVATVVLPIFAWQAERFISSAEETEDKLVLIQQDVKILATQMQFLRENLTRLENRSEPVKTPVAHKEDI